MIESLLNGILNALTDLVTFLLTPLNLLFNGLFPDISSSIAVFNTFVNNFIGDTLGYFFYLLPPLFKTLLLSWFLFLITYYAVYYTYIGLIKVFAIIQKIKFW